MKLKNSACSKKKRFPKLPVAAATMATLVVLSIPASLPVLGQEVQAAPAQITVGGVKITGVPNDWSLRHVVFSNPGTEEQAIRNSKHDEWLRIVNEPRYIIQQLHRHAQVQGPAAAQVAALEAQTAAVEEPAADKKRKIHKDWSEGLGAADVYSNTYPAKWSFSATTASCANDFVVYPTGSNGTGVIAYNNLYSGCGGSVPSVYWAYNSVGTVVLSPVFSADGSQVAFVSINSSNVSSLVLQKWAASTTETFASPGTAAAVSASNYPSCTAPCVTTLVFNGSPPAYFSYSSDPFYDYGTDSLYAGDRSGNLHKFQPVFNGIPAEVTTSGWPVTLNVNFPTGSPVYDSVSGCVFMGTWGGYFYSVNSGNPGTQCTSTTGSVQATSVQYGGCYGIVDGPLLDSTAGSVYVFIEDDDLVDVVAQFSAGFTGLAATASAVFDIGAGDRENGCDSDPVWAGAFDNVYFESSTPTSPSGDLYVAGNTYGPLTLYQLTITNNALTASAAGPVLGSSGFPFYPTWFSPVTEFCNNGLSACTSDGAETTQGTDYIFVSSYDGAPAGCISSGDAGCVMSFTVSTPSSFSSGTAPNAPLNVPDANGYAPTGGIIIDNSVGSGTLAGASQTYFLTLDPSATCGNGVTGLCATQASQSAP